MADFILVPNNTFETTLEFNTLISDFENGSEQRRSKWSSQRRSWHLIYANRNSTELATIKTLFESKLGAGTSFTWTNPLDNIDYTVRFKDNKLPYNRISNNLYNIEFDLIEVK